MTTKAKLIYDELCKDFLIGPNENITTCSYDSSNNQNFVENSTGIFNFDKIDNQCQTLKNSKSKNMSADCLIYRASNDTLYFLEFKSGKCKYKDIRYKIIDGFTNLYHYALKKKIISSRDEYLEINFRFCLVRRDAGEIYLRDTILGDLERGEELRGTEVFNDLEDFYLKKVSIVMTPEKVPDLLFTITDGLIKEINYHYIDNVVKKLTTALV